MKKFRAVGLFAGFFCASLFVALHIIFLNSQHQVHHRGALIGADSFTHTFRIPNYAWKALEVGNVRSSCGCTVVGELPKSIPPFRSLYVPVRINLTGRSGVFKSNVSVDLKGYGVAELALTADIYPMMPNVIALGRVRKGDLVESSYAITEVLDIESFGEAVSAALETLDGQPVIQLRVNAPLKGGEFEIPILHDADSPVFKGYVLQDVEARDSSLSLGLLQSGRGPATDSGGVAAFFSPYGRRFRWREDLTDATPGITIARDAEQSDKEGVALRIQLNEVPDRGAYHETINLQFEVLESGEIVSIPLEVFAYVLTKSA